MKTFKTTLTIIGIGLLVAVSAARADLFQLTSDHCTGGCGPAGTVFGTVNLVQNGTTVDFTVHLNSGFAFAKTGAADDQAFKFNSSVALSLAAITVNQTVPGQTLAADTGAFNGDGTGNFSFGIICSTCGGGLSSAFMNDIVFHVANATVSQFEVANSIGTFFVADIGNVMGTGSPFNGNTGPIDAGPGVPDGGTTLMLLGSALGGLGLMRRFFRR